MRRTDCYQKSGRSRIRTNVIDTENGEERERERERKRSRRRRRRRRGGKRETRRTKQDEYRRKQRARTLNKSQRPTRLNRDNDRSQTREHPDKPADLSSCALAQPMCTSHEPSAAMKTTRRTSSARNCRWPPSCRPWWVRNRSTTTPRRTKTVTIRKNPSRI